MQNSPRNAFVEDFVVDFLASESLSDRMEAGASLPEIPNDLTEIEISHAISHGKIGACSGSITTSGAKEPFAVFIEFTSTKGFLARRVSLYLAATALP